jgi:hypothetical protein
MGRCSSTGGRKSGSPSSKGSNLPSPYRSGSRPASPNWRPPRAPASKMRRMTAQVAVPKLVGKPEAKPTSAPTFRAVLGPGPRVERTQVIRSASHGLYTHQYKLWQSQIQLLTHAQAQTDRARIFYRWCCRGGAACIVYSWRGAAGSGRSRAGTSSASSGIWGRLSCAGWVVRVRVLRRALARGDLKRLQRFPEFVSVHVHLGTGVDMSSLTMCQAHG